VADFEWTVHADAEALVCRLLDRALAASPALGRFAERLRRETSTLLVDWVDHVAAPLEEADLRAAGYAPTDLPGGVWRHPGAQLPALVPSAGGAGIRVALKVDEAAAFAAAHAARGPVQGAPLSGLRLVEAWSDGGVTVLGAERRSWATGVEPATLTAAGLGAAAEARDRWLRRNRHLPTDEGLALATRSAAGMIDLAGKDLAAAYVMEGERAYWQRRNRAAQLQHARQERLGMGWGNQDHHTFRSGRRGFRDLMGFFATLGFRPRERFYAGDEAGWGAQIQEHPGTGCVVFADVDLEPDERALDFAARPLPESARMGTVGLWCELHGESLLAAGMHHLEGQFDFDRLRDDLGREGVGFMAPFSDMDHLRQAFTQAELWPVDPERVEALLAAGHIEAERARSFIEHGAPGSHLENLARRGGFKGFNQQNVSKTMRATDPRRYRAEEPAGAGARA
jgi:hypothetical protein